MNGSSKTAGVPPTQSLEDASQIHITEAPSTEDSLGLSAEKQSDIDAIATEQSPVIDFPNGGLRGKADLP